MSNADRDHCCAWHATGRDSEDRRLTRPPAARFAGSRSSRSAGPLASEAEPGHGGVVLSGEARAEPAVSGALGEPDHGVFLHRRDFEASRHMPRQRLRAEEFNRSWVQVPSLTRSPPPGGRHGSAPRLPAAGEMQHSTGRDGNEEDARQHQQPPDVTECQRALRTAMPPPRGSAAGRFGPSAPQPRTRPRRAPRRAGALEGICRGRREVPMRSCAGRVLFPFGNHIREFPIATVGSASEPGLPEEVQVSGEYAPAD